MQRHIFGLMGLIGVARKKGAPNTKPNLQNIARGPPEKGPRIFGNHLPLVDLFLKHKVQTDSKPAAPPLESATSGFFYLP